MSNPRPGGKEKQAPYTLKQPLNFSSSEVGGLLKADECFTVVFHPLLEILRQHSKKAPSHIGSFVHLFIHSFYKLFLKMVPGFPPVRPGLHPRELQSGGADKLVNI